MKKNRITESQIVRALKEHEAGKKAEDISRELKVNRATFYNWKKKYSGMDTSHLKELKALQEENRRLKQMYADLSLDNRILKDVIEKKL